MSVTVLYQILLGTVPYNFQNTISQAVLEVNWRIFASFRYFLITFWSVIFFMTDSLTYL